MQSFMHEVKDKPCSDGNGWDLMRVYFPIGARIYGDVTDVPSASLSPEEAWTHAESRLPELVARYSNRKDIHVAAMSLGVLCFAHRDEFVLPVFEVHQNIIVIQPNAVQVVVGGMRRMRGPHDEGAGALTMEVPIYPADINMAPLLAEEEIERSAAYLPRENYDFTAQNHPGIVSAPGGASFPITFGLGGGEISLVREPFPDTRDPRFPRVLQAGLVS